MSPTPVAFSPTPVAMSPTPVAFSPTPVAFSPMMPVPAVHAPAVTPRRGVIFETFATIANRMRLNLFSRNLSSAPDPEPQHTTPQATPATSQGSQPRTGRTFPADEVVWGIAIRNGFDEIDDPWYHRGTTQHAYLEGNDNVALCGFRPPQSGSRLRRRARLGLPTTGEHPMCGMCARMVVAPRPRVPVPVQVVRPVAVPVTRGGTPAPQIGAGKPMTVTPAANPAPVAATVVVSPWVRRAAGTPEPVARPALPESEDGGLLARGVHSEVER
jgi:hypothetical protein